MAEFLHNVRQWLIDPNAIKFVQVAIGLMIIAVLFRSLERILPQRVHDSDLRYRLRKLIHLVGYIVMGFLVIGIFSDRLGQLTVLFGVVGAGVAFALQEVIVSFAGWVAISFGQFYKPGDRVQLGGIMGDVIDISILRTTLMECGDWVKSDLYNGRIVRIANSFVFREPVFNYSGDFRFLWDEIVIPVRHGSDYRLAGRLFQEIAEQVTGVYIEPAKADWQQMVHKYLIEDAKIEPFVTLIATDNWLEFTVRYVVEYKKRRIVKDLLFNRILETIEAYPQKVMLASTTVEIVAAPNLQVQTAQDQHQPPPPVTYRSSPLAD